MTMHVSQSHAPPLPIAPPHAVTISIANAHLEIASPHREVVEWVAARYAAYQSHAAPQARLLITLDPALPPLPQWEDSPRFSFDAQGGLTFDHSLYRVQSDWSRRHAFLHATAHLPRYNLVYLIRALFAIMLVEQGGLLLHGAGLVRKGQAYLFLGPSGTGKTTVARLSHESGLAEILNDDLVALMPEGDRWIAYATPFHNPTQAPFAPRPHSAPLRGVYKLVQAPHVAANPLPLGQALAALSAAVVVVMTDERRVPVLLERLALLQVAHPVVELKFTRSTCFWNVVAS